MLFVFMNRAKDPKKKVSNISTNGIFVEIFVIDIINKKRGRLKEKSHLKTRLIF